MSFKKIQRNFEKLEIKKEKITRRGQMIPTNHHVGEKAKFSSLWKNVSFRIIFL